MEVVGFREGRQIRRRGPRIRSFYIILAFPSRDARDKAWTSFRGVPEWQAVSEESEKNGTLTEKIDSSIMMATDYSPGEIV